MGVVAMSAPFRGHQFLAITGTPGAGKSTLAAAISASLHVPVLSAGDVARAVDDQSRATGAMAAEDLFRDEWGKRVSDSGSGPLILEGIPRKMSQLDLLPPSTLTIALMCTWEISELRLLARNRIDDGFARERYEAQLVQFGANEVGQLEGTWIMGLVGPDNLIRTDNLTPQEVTRSVMFYLSGLSVSAWPRVTGHA